MALTIHWEWRAFGKLSARFQRRFDRLDFPFGERPQKIVDEYLWIPGVEINLKFRQGAGAQDGLKFKRLDKTRGAFEKWVEAENEIFPFPLSGPAWQLLRHEMKIASHQRFNPPLDAYRTDALLFLQAIDPRIRTVVVHKERLARLWTPRPDCQVKVEVAQILSPTRTTSVGLEIMDREGRMDDASSIALLQEMITNLTLDSESVEPMNYLHYLRRSGR